jgi:uncharacterized protein YlbG (UPF0298 family)
LKGDTQQRAYFALGPKPNLAGLLNLAVTVDAYRKFIFSNLRQLDADISARKYGTDILVAWKETHASLQRLEARGQSVSGLQTTWKLRSASLVVGMILVMLALVAVTQRMSAWVFYGSFYLALIFLAVFGGLSYLSSRRTNSYIHQHSIDHSLDMLRAKDFVQKILNSLSRYFSETKTDPTKHPFSLYNTDYKRIRVEKGPSLRQTYEVVIERK